jgi:hypothetical protein
MTLNALRTAAQQAFDAYLQGRDAYRGGEFDETDAAMVNLREVLAKTEKPIAPPELGVPLSSLPVIIAADGGKFAPVGTVTPPEMVADGVPTLPLDGSTFDPEQYPELALALRPLNMTPGQLPDLRGRVAKETP